MMVIVIVVVAVVEKNLPITHAILLKLIDIQVISVVSSYASTQATAIVIWLCGPAFGNSRSLGVRDILVVGQVRHISAATRHRLTVVG